MLRTTPVFALAFVVLGCDPHAPAPDEEPAAGREQPAGSVWQPKPGTTWQWQLVGAIDTSVDAEAFDVDLFETPDDVIEELHASGRFIICYFSAGSFEEGRPDADAFPKKVIGTELDGWPGERWLDTRSEAVRDIMRARLDLARDRGCDAVEPDNVDGFENDPGFALTADTQLDYNRFLAKEAHARDLSIGLKNGIAQLEDLVDDYDWALNEECFAYDECDAYESTFLARGKAVFHAEYVSEDRLDEVCAKTKPLGISTLIKNLDLDSWYRACP